jgi:DNA-binding XRE family transcriptional regulator
MVLHELPSPRTALSWSQLNYFDLACNLTLPLVLFLRKAWLASMRELGSPRHEILRRLLKERRERANLSQQEVADRIGRGQTFVSAVERGGHRVSVLEFLDFAEAIGFDAAAALRRVAKAAKR